VLRRLTTARKIQRFLDEDIGYNKEKGGATCRGPAARAARPLAHCRKALC